MFQDGIKLFIYIFFEARETISYYRYRYLRGFTINLGRDFIHR